MLQAPYHLHGPPLDSFQETPVFFRMGSGADAMRDCATEAGGSDCQRRGCGEPPRASGPFLLAGAGQGAAAEVALSSVILYLCTLVALVMLLANSVSCCKYPEIDF